MQDPNALCATDPPFAYHAPKTESDAAKWLAGQLGDVANDYDTPSTVDQVRKHNAAHRAVCGPK